MKKKDYYGEYKEDHQQHQDGNEIFINKTKEEEAFIKRLIFMNFKKNSYNI